MSSPRRLSRRDLEALSAYLDGELPAAEARRLEARLQDRGELRAALAELGALRQAMRSLPPVRPPRSFTLTPDMVGHRPRVRTYPALQLATALASIAFLLVSGANVLLSRGFALEGRAPAEAPMMLQAAPSQAEPSEAVEAAGAPVLGEAPAYDALAPTGTPEAAERAAVPEAPTLGGGLTDTPEVGAAPLASQLAAEPSPTATPTPQEIEATGLERPGIDLRPLVWLQLGLGALAIGLAVITLRARRTER